MTRKGYKHDQRTGQRNRGQLLLLFLVLMVVEELLSTNMTSILNLK